METSNYKFSIQCINNQELPHAITTEDVKAALNRRYTTQEDMELRLETYLVEISEELGVQVTFVVGNQIAPLTAVFWNDRTMSAKTIERMALGVRIHSEMQHGM